MKRIAITLAIIPLLFTACTRNPYADFIADKRTVEVGEDIVFTNRSSDAVDYEWDFDDGYYSYNFNAVHSWTTPGYYTVSLSAWGRDDQVDRAFMDIEVIQPYAELEITVEEYYEPYYLVSDARVRLYPTVPDWENETNMIVQGYTNESGKVIFIDLPANRRYYVDVWGPLHDNIQLASEDVGWIETDVLIPDVRNYWTAVVDYYGDDAKSAPVSRAVESLKKATRDAQLRTPGERIKPEGYVQSTR